MKQTFDEILTEFAKRDTAGFVVWGQKLDAAHKREITKLRECLDEAVTILNCHIDGNPETCDDHKCILFDHENKSNCIMCKWRKALEGVKDVE